MSSDALDLSVVIPVYNEEGNIEPLWNELVMTLEAMTRPKEPTAVPVDPPAEADPDATEIVREGKIPKEQLRPLRYEVIFIDDGSTDRSRGILRGLVDKNVHARVIVLRRRFGQSAAIAAGVDGAQGDVVITMDSDRQSDPADMPRLLNAIDSGYDVVCGRRTDRRGVYVQRVPSSRIINWLVRRVFRVALSDIGCTLKAFRRDIVSEVTFEPHRFMPIVAHARGATLAELQVNHRSREAGSQKLGAWRHLAAVFDLVSAKYLLAYAARPMHLFGLVGVVFFAASAVLTAVALGWHLADGAPMTWSLLAAGLAFMLGSQSVVAGLLAEQRRAGPEYAVKRPEKP